MWLAEMVDVWLGSDWGVAGMSVLTPKTVAFKVSLVNKYYKQQFYKEVNSHSKNLLD